MQVSNVRGAKALETLMKYCAERQDDQVRKCTACKLEGCLLKGMYVAPKPYEEIKSTIGETYGLWKVTSNPVKEGTGNRTITRVDCICECGHTARIQYRTLKNGMSSGCKSCKCGRKKA